MDVQERFDLITRNLQEVIGEEQLMEKLSSGADLSIYWGTMPTGSPSIAYFFPMMKIADFLRAGCTVKVLNADLHAALDSTPWELLDARYEYYQEVIITMLKVLGVDTSKLEFVKGSSIQLSSDYQLDLLKLSTFSSVHDATRASSEVVKASSTPRLSGLVYPLMQALDEQYLGVDAQFGGVDQRKIMVFAREHLPKIGYAPRIELMNPMIRGLVGERMSSSVVNSKIDLFDDDEVVKKKVNAADCVAGDSDNGLMSLLKHLFFVIKADSGESLVIERPEKYGGNLEYSSYSDVEKAFVDGSLHPLDLKNAVAAEITALLSKFQENGNLRKLYEKAYSE
jgi:tyrosyl-tRNA synthetase